MAKFVVAAASPGDGPLFPATPEQDRYQDVIVPTKVGDDKLPDSESVGKLATNDGFLPISPAQDLTQNQIVRTSDNVSVGKMSFTIRLKNGMISVLQTIDASAMAASTQNGWNLTPVMYGYCWRKGTTPVL